MKTRSLAAAALAAAAALILSACSASTATTPSPADATLHIALSSAIDSWNPQDALAAQSYQVFPQVFGSLLETSPDGSKITPSLATKYEFDDAAPSITFHLDPDAKFSDGTPLTADDVVFSEGLWAAGAIYGSYFASIASVTASDAHTVVFNLSSPDHSLLGILATANAAIVPKDFGGADAKEFWKKPISAGPYAIADEKVGETIDLVTNKNFRAGFESRPSKVHYAVVADAAQRLLQFQSGEVDIVNAVQADSASQYDPKLLKSTESSGVSVLVTQTKVAPFNDPNFRKALNLAIDHKALLEGGYVGQAKAATTLLPQIIPGVKACDGCDWSKTDVEQAKALVKGSAYDGRSLKLSVSGDSGPQLLAAQAMVPMFAQIGVTVTVDAQPTSTFIDNLGKGAFDMSALTYSALAPSPLDPLGFLAATGIVFSGADTAAAQTAVTALASAATEDAMGAATSAFEQWAFDEMPVIPLAMPNVIYAVSAKVKGFVPNHYAAYSVAPLSLQG